MNTTAENTPWNAAEPVNENASGPIVAKQDAATGGGVDSRFCCNICLEAVVDPVATLCGHLYCWPCLFRWLEPGMHPEERAGLGILQQPLAIDSNRRVCPVCKAPCAVPNLVPIYVREPNEDQSHNTTGESPETTSNLQLEDEGDKVGTSRTEGRKSEAQDGNSSYGASASEPIDLGVSGSITGLRQRIRFRSRDSENSADTVPSRPPANSPRQNASTPPDSTPPTPQRYRTSSWVAPLTPTGHRGSLTHGLLLSLQQAASGTSGVPPLHRRDGAHPVELDSNPGATEYLSRLLIMLASFVILCLLVL